MENNNQKLSEDLFAEEPRIEFITPEERKLKEQEKTRAIISANKGKLISLGIALIYLFLGTLAGGGEGFFRTLLFLILPLALIWFSEALSGHTGSSWGLGGSMVKRIDAPTPAGILKFIGWIFLFYPIIKIIFVAIFLTS
jgi:hypothetical protein